jgi:hypothetical protein
VVTADRTEQPRPRVAAAAVLCVAFAVALTIGVYAKVHDPGLRPVFLVGFSGMLQMKVWLTTAAFVLALVQLATALAMWGKLPTAGLADDRVATLHRWSGAAAFAAITPVALHCVWSLGFADATPRVFVHSICGCAFFGGYAAKMLGLRLRGLPSWALPVLGGTVFASFIIVWLTSALWFFTRSGVALT